MPADVSTATARAVFSPVHPGGRVGAVAQRLTDAIRLGIIAAGEQLPSEADLAQQFGVAPVTLRDALAVVRELGLIETRRGRGGGTFVLAPVDAVGGALPLLSPHEQRDLGDHRRAIAGTAAALAARRAQGSDIVELRGHLERLRSATTITELHRADARFHVEVAASAQSPRLTRAEMDLRVLVGNLIWVPVPASGVRAIVEEHAAILQALEARDESVAQSLAEAHVEAETERMLAFRLGVGGG